MSDTGRVLAAQWPAGQGGGVLTPGDGPGVHQIAGAIGKGHAHHAPLGSAGRRQGRQNFVGQVRGVRRGCVGNALVFGTLVGQVSVARALVRRSPVFEPLVGARPSIERRVGPSRVGVVVGLGAPGIVLAAAGEGGDDHEANGQPGPRCGRTSRRARRQRQAVVVRAHGIVLRAARRRGHLVAPSSGPETQSRADLTASLAGASGRRHPAGRLWVTAAGCALGSGPFASGRPSYVPLSPTAEATTKPVPKAGTVKLKPPRPPPSPCTCRLRPSRHHQDGCQPRGPADRHGGQATADRPHRPSTP